MSEWRLAQRRDWAALRDAEITGWVGEDAFVEELDDGTFTFAGQDDPFRQLAWVGIETGGAGPDFRVSTYQNDAVWGLSVERVESQRLIGSDGVRTADLSNMPTGAIGALDLHVHVWRESWGGGDDIVEVTLTIAGRSVLLVAGEIWPEISGPMIVWADESVLVFDDAARADTITWNGSTRDYTVEHLG